MLCLALLMQVIVSIEFEASQRQSKTPVLKFVDSPYVCDCAEGIFIKQPPRDLYQPLPFPARLEPDKSCEARLASRPVFDLSHIRLNSLWILDPERAAELERLKKEKAEKDKQGKCLLILKS